MTVAERVTLPNHAGTVAWGEAFGRRLRQGDVVLLHGDLGAGKTTLAQGIAAGLQVEDAIQSPTFSLVAEHPAVDGDGVRITLYHLDLYRLTDEAELEGLGYEQYIAPVNGISVIEWPERAGDWLPQRFWLIHLEPDGDGGRRVSVRRHEQAAAAANPGFG